MHVIQNTKLDSKEGAVKIGGRNSNNLKYVDDIILKAQSIDSIDLEQLLIRVKEKKCQAELHLNIQKTSWLQKKYTFV